MILDRKRKSENKYESAFNVAIRFGFCGDCRKGLDPDRCEGFDCYENAVKVIADALEKQIPVKPILVKDVGEFYYKCPVCENEFDDYIEDTYYCECCGSKLDWSGKE